MPPIDPDRLRRYRYLFFFSYARHDDDVYLQRFFADLSSAVQRKSTHATPSYRDVNDIGPGDDWSDELVDALQGSQTLLCIYSPFYFVREYCGKEFAVFLKRQGVTLDGDGVVHGSQRIIPVLWLREKDLARLGLPPEMVRNIQYTVSNHRSLYAERGLGGILRRAGRRGAYHDIIEELADVIVSRCATELPPLPGTPSLQAVPNVFAGPVPPAPGGPNVLRLFYVTAPERVLVAEDPLVPGRAEALRTLVSEVALQLGMRCELEQVDPLDRSTVDALTARLANATALGETVMVLTRSADVSRVAEESLAVLTRAMTWRGGVMILGQDDDPAPAAVVDRIHAGRSQDDAARVTLSALSGSYAEFRTALSSFIAQLRQRATVGGTVRRHITTDGPQSKPLVRGPTAVGR